ncbi:MAG: hypothetical protein GZ086_01040 [Gelidibacter sp.]|nr:hypothetical protein [Gelidibacter sp.]
MKKNKKPTMYKILIILLFSILLISCEENPIDGPRGYKYNVGDLPDSPVNLENFNTIYDDYNSTGPSLGRLIPFCFSTNRDSHGNEFDIIYQPMNIDFDKTSGILKVTNKYTNWDVFVDDFEVIKKGLSKINTTGNEFGPYLIVKYDFNDLYFTLLYASDITGNFEINYTSNKSNPDFSAIKPVEFLNSEFDDLYPTFNSDKNKIYFCSNRDNANFDIYYTNILNPENELELILSDTNEHSIVKDTNISSSADDKCPFVYNNILVFTSNREGGFGGFDLYYCKFENNSWGNPINFGAKINSEFDEYRPILIDEEVTYKETMMVFSSNRTGGKGGFDLYYVGVTTE